MRFRNLLASFGFGMCCLVQSASGESSFPNVSTFFGNNPYGTFALVWGAEHSSGIRKGPFVPISEGELFRLPKQRAYCFVVQHYGGAPVGAKHEYRIKFHANDRDTDLKTLVDANFSRTYKVTDRASREMPSYCFRRRGRDHFWIEIGSSDGDWFDGNYELTVE